MDDKITKEKNKKIKRKLMLSAAGLTVVVVIILLIIFVLTFNKSNLNNGYVVPNSYSFTGNILSTSTPYSDISLIIEEKNNSLYGITLKNNELVAEKMFNTNLDYSDVNDYSIVFNDYDGDSNKDFVYLYNKMENGYVYKFYSVDKMGNIRELNIDNITVDAKKASLNLVKDGEKYEYRVPDFYYDGYKVSAEIGEHELNQKSNVETKTISKNSKISIDGRYDALPRKVSVLEQVPEYVRNVNSYLAESENLQAIMTDLDGNKQAEYIVSYVKDGRMYVSLFDSSANFVVNVMDIDEVKEFSDVIEIADIDNDGVMEIIGIKEKSLEIHRYNNGFYY